MARRKASLLQLLLILPWWVSVVLACAAYLGLTFVAPNFLTGSPAGTAFAKALPKLTRAICGLLLVLAFASFVRAKIIAWKFDAQRSIEDIRALSWREFESIVGEAFRRQGYFVAENAVDGADGGIDLVLRKDGKKYFVQCKQWKNMTVGVKPVREFFGVMSAHKADGGFFVASGVYTQEARAFAETTGIRIVDGKSLARLVAEVREGPRAFGSGVVHRIEPEISSMDTAVPACPVCSGAMVARTAKRGAGAGSRFWGCAKYPACRGTRPLLVREGLGSRACSQSK